ncbi:hypothetical protein PVAP13_2NG601020 [Panicum virgatum]|uniref:Uncharacterized protein n=1 Tax=Panicum virgatum TaxID=38727 RepID=A0A8T0VZF7_PANVG|nr:hypothetical protein PVAP13_2NG601020 [Panicum virgatum]
MVGTARMLAKGASDEGAGRREARSDWLRPAQRFRLECSEQLRRGGALCARRMHREGESRNSLASTLISVARFGKQQVFLLLDSIWILTW